MAPQQHRRARRTAERILRAPIRRGAWDKVKWPEVRDLALERLRHPERIAQGSGTYLCGPTAVINATATYNPVRYARLVREVFARGSFNDLQISQRLLASSPAKARTEPGQPRDNANSLDWMLLSAARNAYGRSAYVGQRGFHWSAANLPREIRRWMQDVAGFKRVRRLGGIWAPLLGRSTERIGAMNAALTSGKPQAVIVLLQMRGLRETGMLGLHWARLAKPIERLSGDRMRMTIHDHGENRTFITTRRGLRRAIRQVYVAW